MLQRDYKQRLRAERRERESASRLAVTLASIGDGVIATDREGRIVFMNRVAEALSGWSLREAQTRDLSEVFRIINESTRAPVENPVTAVLRSGLVVGLANHTLLIARDGTEIPIDDSGAPVRDGEGQLMGVVLVFHDCRERKQLEQESRRAALAEAARVLQAQAATAVRASEQRLQLALKAAHAAAWEWDVASGRVEWSADYYDLVGLEPPGSYDDWLASMVEEDRAPTDALVRRTLDEQPFLPIEYRVHHPSRGVRWLLAIGRVENEGRNAPRVLGIALDITDRKLAEAERDELLGVADRARAEAEAANQAKDRFLAVLSHELRSPLSAVLGWVGVGRASVDQPATIARALTTIERNVRQQAELVDDLLDVSRIASGRLTFERETVDLAAVVRETVESLVASAKAVVLRTVVPPGPVTVVGDRRRLGQVVQNLLSNAIKFTPEGGTVDVSLLQGQTDRCAQLTVRDTGEGIAADALPHIFDPFRQEDAAVTRRHGGLGLGLAIVQHVVSSHGGTVTAASPGKGAGATMTVTLPLADLSLEAATRRDDPSAENLAGIRMLVVDDDPDNLEPLCVLLTQAGAIVDAASSADEALAALDRAWPHVLVSDLGMPDRDGYGLIECVRARARQPLRAIAISGFAAPEDRDRALRAGFDLHFPKPLDFAAFFAAVVRLHGTIT